MELGQRALNGKTVIYKRNCPPALREANVGKRRKVRQKVRKKVRRKVAQNVEKSGKKSAKKSAKTSKSPARRTANCFRQGFLLKVRQKVRRKVAQNIEKSAKKSAEKSPKTSKSPPQSPPKHRKVRQKVRRNIEKSGKKPAETSKSPAKVGRKACRRVRSRPRSLRSLCRVARPASGVQVVFASCCLLLVTCEAGNRLPPKVFANTRPALARKA